MYPARFEYHAPSSVEEALSILERYGDEGKVIAGGQSLIPLMKLRFASPSALVDINRIEGLDTIEEKDGFLSIGALVRHKACEHSELLQGRYGVLGDAAPWISDPIVRNRGTVVGSLVHADPQGDWGSALIAADAELEVVGSGGARTIPLDELFRRAVPDEHLPDRDRDGGPGSRPRRARRRDVSEARAQGRRLRHRRRRRPRVAFQRHDRTRGDRAHRRRAEQPAGDRGRGSADRRGAERRDDHEGGRAGRRGRHSRAQTIAAPSSTSEASSGSSRSEGSARRSRRPRRRKGRTMAAAETGVYTTQLTVTVNGASRSQEVENRLLLVHFLRETLGLTGTHIGCDTTHCGACTVLVDGRPREVVHAVRGSDRRHRDHDRRGPRARRRAPPGSGGLPRGARPPVRLLHAGDDADRGRPARREPEPDGERDPLGASPGTSAAAPATRTSSRRSSTRPRRCRKGASDGRHRRSGHPRRRPFRQASRRRTLHPRQGNVLRRHRAPADAPPGVPAQPVRARAHQLDRHLTGRGGRGRRRGRHGRAARGAQPRLDADALRRHPGRARHRQGALPGPGGRGRHRRVRLHRQGRVRAHRRRLRAAPGDHLAPAGARRRRGGHPRREGRAGRQPHLPLGGGRQGRDRSGLRGRRQGRLARHLLPALPPGAARVLRLRRGRQPRDGEVRRST